MSDIVEILARVMAENAFQQWDACDQKIWRLDAATAIEVIRNFLADRGCDVTMLESTET